MFKKINKNLEKECDCTKRIIVLAFAVVLIFGLVGCSTTGTKTSLKLNHKLGVDSEYLTDGQEMVMAVVDYIEINLAETSYTKYTDGVLPELVSLINHQYPNVLNSNWEYMVHFYDEQQTTGLVQFRYVINNEILTDKSITFHYENGVINSVAYSNISKTVDEDDIVSRVATFKEKHTQEQKKLKSDEEFIKETIQYSYDYDADKLMYTYNLFFYKGQYELKIIDNETVTEYFIDENGNAID